MPIRSNVVPAAICLLLCTLAPAVQASYPLPENCQLGAGWHKAASSLVFHKDVINVATYPGHAVTYLAGSTDGSTMIVSCANNYANFSGDGFMQWGPVSNSYNSFQCIVECHNTIQRCAFIICELYHNSDHLPTPKVSASPSGTYVGKKSSLGVSVTATVKIDDTTTMDFSISGAASINCPGQTYSVGSSGAVTLPTDKDSCIYNSLHKYSLSSLHVTYSSSADTVTVSIKESIFPITIVLKKQSAVFTAPTAGCPPAAIKQMKKKGATWAKKTYCGTPCGKIAYNMSPVGCPKAAVAVASNTAGMGLVHKSSAVGVGRGCGFSCKTSSDCDAPCGVCDDGYCEAQVSRGAVLR